MDPKYHVCWPRLTAKRVEPVVSISWASCLTPSTGTQLQGKPRQQPRRKWKIFLRFLTEIAVYLGNGVHIGNINRQLQVTDRSMSVPMTLSDLEKRDARGQLFQPISLVMFVRFDLERPNLEGWHMGRAYFPGVSHGPYLKGTATSLPNI